MRAEAEERVTYLLELRQVRTERLRNIHIGEVRAYSDYFSLARSSLLHSTF